MLLQTAIYWTNQGQLATKDEDVSEEESEAQHRQHLAWHNFRDVCKDLPVMQTAMQAMFVVTADYFNTAALNADEKRAYGEAADLLDVWLKHPLPPGVSNIEAHVTARRDVERRGLIARLHQVLAPLEAEGMTFLYPKDVIEDFPSTLLPVGFSVDDPGFVATQRDRVLEALMDFENDITFYWLVPTFDGARFLEGGFRASTTVPDEDDEDSWRLRLATLGEQPIPDDVWQVLPSPPMRPSRRLKLLATMHVLVSQIAHFLHTREILGGMRTTGDPYDAKPLRTAQRAFNDRAS